uniref:Uncharacterized protein n=1 Tax=Arundo donax TaxID=35708 RepID=A0A0A9E0W9_ARUDO
MRAPVGVSHLNDGRLAIIAGSAALSSPAAAVSSATTSFTMSTSGSSTGSSCAASVGTSASSGVCSVVFLNDGYSSSSTEHSLTLTISTLFSSRKLMNSLKFSSVGR